MKMIGCGGAAFRAVVEYSPAGTEIGHELQQTIDMCGNGLWAMVDMGDGEVSREDRHRVTKDQIGAPVKDASLIFREMTQAEETGPAAYILLTHSGQGAFDSSGVVLKEDGEPFTGDMPLRALPERFVAFAQKRPRAFLLREEFEAKTRKMAGAFSSVKFGVDLFSKQRSALSSFDIMAH
jgi:hypothetical protein